jgi:ABC-type uncharacterized transport system ATPase subunit
MDPILHTENLTKRFHQVVANHQVCFDVMPGEIHCLLGENGAGKSTLAECIYGFYRPEEGRICLNGKPVQMLSPADAISHGIGMVHQHFVLVPTLTVLENIVVGTEASGLILDLGAAETELSRLCAQYGVELDLHAKVWQLPVGQQQWVEILKALFVKARLLILDEPTAVLTPQESERLFEILRMMTDEGMSIILISHKLKEVMQSDRVTILRKGQKVATVTTAQTSKEELTSLMIGREVGGPQCKDVGVAGEELLRVKGLHALDDRKQEALRGIDLVVHRGEIVGIAGVAGNGQKELFEALVGVRVCTGGKVTLNGGEITNRSPGRIQELGVAFIPEDRFAEGLVPDFSVEENLILGGQRNNRFKSRGFLDFGRISAFAKDCIKKYGIATPSGKTLARTLSGGNAQKLIVAREFERNAALTLANQPSRGLDVGVIEYMHAALLEKRASGGGILLASEDLDELFAIADTIVVIHKGRILGRFAACDADLQTIGLLMAGHRREAKGELAGSGTAAS